MTTILIVDDNPRMRHALRRCLEVQEGWTIIGEAEDGQTAIDFVREKRPDVVLLDYAMPG